MQAIDDNRCCDDLIAGEDASDRTTLFRGDERKVEQARLFDPAMDAGCAEPLRCGNPASW
jgi:hypothetical protein